MARLLKKPVKQKVSKPEAKGTAMKLLQEKGYLSIAKSADYLGIHAYTLREHIASGFIIPFDMGSRQYLDESALGRLKDLLEEHGSLARAAHHLAKEGNEDA